MQIGVIGAGQMGAGIAQVSAQAGFQVFLSDVDLARAEAGKVGIAKQLARAVDKGKLDEAARDTALANIAPVGEVEAMAPAALVIEAATEREEVKRAIFKTVGAVLSVVDRAEILVKGSLVWSGRPEALRADPELMQRHLGV